MDARTSLTTPSLGDCTEDRPEHGVVVICDWERAVMAKDMAVFLEQRVSHQRVLS
jgi:hypothetical protein